MVVKFQSIFCAETRNQKPDTRDQKPDTRNQRSETRNQKLETKNQKPDSSFHFMIRFVLFGLCIIG